MVEKVRQIWSRFVVDARTNRLARLGFVLALAILVVDQVSKWVVIGPLGLSPEGCLAAALGDPVAPYTCQHIELTAFFDISMVWNTGVAFGLLSAEGLGDRIKLIVGALAISAGLAVWISRCRRFWTAIAAGMIFGGAIGNIIDRVRFGAVVDFLNFAGGTPGDPRSGWFGWVLPAERGPLRWVDEAMFYADGRLGVGFPYVFNVADMGVSVGVALLLLDWYLEERRAEGEPGAEKTTSPD